MKPLHELIKEYRVSKGITQTYIASMTGISNKKISNIENGRTELKADEFLLICKKGLNVDPSFFTKEVLETKENSTS